MRSHVVLGTICGLLCLAVSCGGPGYPTAPDDAVSFVAEGLLDNKPEVLWDALPASYQADITELTHQLGATMDRDVHAQLMAMAQKTVGILVDKKDLILSTPLLRAAPAGRELAEANWDGVVALVETLISSDLGNLDALAQLDVRSFVAGTGATLLGQAMDLSARSADGRSGSHLRSTLEGLQVDVVHADADTALLRLTVPGHEPGTEMTWVKVEERWVPQWLAEQWQARVEAVRHGIAAVSRKELAPKKLKVMLFLGLADTMLDQIDAADSSQQLEQTVSGLAGSLARMGLKLPQTAPRTR